MATLRDSGYSVGNIPPQVTWTVVRGDTAAFTVYVTDDDKAPLTIADWVIAMKVKRPTNAVDLGVITDTASVILTLTPAALAEDLVGEFTVSLTASESLQLETGDIFDIQLSNAATSQVWTVAQGKLVIVEDVTD
jgi:hypothetical protein